MVSGFFHGAVAATSGPGKFRKNPSSTARAAAANHPPLLRSVDSSELSLPL
jgi:hypothetical protein